MTFAVAPFGSLPFASAPPAAASTATILAVQPQIALAEIALQSGDGDADSQAGFAVFPFAAQPFAGNTGDPSSAGRTYRYFSDRPYITGPNEDPADEWHAARLRQPLSLLRSVMLSPLAVVDGAQTGRILIEDGDGLLSADIAAQAVDGQPVTVRIGHVGLPYAQFVVAFKGQGVAWRQADGVLTLELRDTSYLLDVPVQPNRYAGTGQAEGTSDMAGEVKPLAFGLCRNVPARLIDPTNLVYQIHDGTVSDISDVYDQGVALTDEGDTSDLWSGSTTSGFYRTDLAAGLFQLGSTPTGQVTADVAGDADSAFGGYDATVGEIARRLLRQRAGLSASAVDGGAFTSLSAAVTGVAGYWIDAPMTAREAVTRLVAGIGAAWYATRDGRISVRRLAAPSANDVTLELDTLNVMALRRVPLPTTLWPPPWRWTVAFRRNWTVQTEDLAGGVTATRRQFLERSWRTATASDSDILVKHTTAIEAPPVESWLDQESDADSLVAEFLALHGADRALYEVEVDSRGLEVGMGANVRLTWPRYRLDSSAVFRAWPIREDLARRRTTLLLWG